MISYYNEVVFNENNFDMTFSVDMVRIHFSISKSKESELSLFMRYLTIEKLADYYQSFRSFNYKFLYSYEGVAIGLMFNGATASDKYKGFIEFNPNKHVGTFFEFKKFINTFAYNFVLHTFDIAVDLKIPRSNVFFLKDKRDYRFFEKYINSASSYGLTEYLGKRNSNGFCKLYNKSLESDLSYDLTRFEITLNELNYANLLKQLPEICFFEDSFFTELNGITLELIKMCYSYGDFTALNFLCKDTRRKIKDALKLKKFKFDVGVFQKLKQQVIDYINY